jgi:hypothetical protein
MKKKFADIGKKAGLEEREIKSFIKIGFSGLLAVALSAFCGFAQAGEKGEDLARQRPDKPPVRENLPENCLLKPDKGPCKAIFWKYYFNPKTKKCEEFLYGGCDGVVPFETQEECQATCIDQQAEQPPYPVSKYGAIGIGDFENGR